MGAAKIILATNTFIIEGKEISVEILPSQFEMVGHKTKIMLGIFSFGYKIITNFSVQAGKTFLSSNQRKWS